jgi:hypothetical protein
VVGHAKARKIFLNIFNAFQLDFDSADLENHPRPGNGAVKVDEPGAAPEKGEKNAVSPENDRVKGNESIEQNKTEHILKMPYFPRI